MGGPIHSAVLWGGNSVGDRVREKPQCAKRGGYVLNGVLERTRSTPLVHASECFVVFCECFVVFGCIVVVWPAGLAGM